MAFKCPISQVRGIDRSWSFPFAYGLRQVSRTTLPTATSHGRLSTHVFAPRKTHRAWSASLLWNASWQACYQRQSSCGNQSTWANISRRPRCVTWITRPGLTEFLSMHCDDWEALEKKGIANPSVYVDLRKQCRPFWASASKESAVADEGALSRVCKARQVAFFFLPLQALPMARLAIRPVIYRSCRGWVPCIV